MKRSLAEQKNLSDSIPIVEDATIPIPIIRMDPLPHSDVSATAHATDSNLTDNTNNASTTADDFLAASSILRFYGQMKATGVRPNIFTYNTLLDTFCKLRDLDSMHMLLTDMTNENVARDTHTFNVFLRMYMFSHVFRIGERKHLVRVLFREMAQAGVRSDDTTRAMQKKFHQACVRRSHLHLRKRGLSEDEIEKLDKQFKAKLRIRSHNMNE
jgi:pentatricopeptide repeat protein